MVLRKISAAALAVLSALPWNVSALDFSGGAPAASATAAQRTTDYAAQMVRVGKLAPAVDKALGKMQDAAVAAIDDRTARRHYGALLAAKRKAVVEALAGLAAEGEDLRGEGMGAGSWAKYSLDRGMADAKAAARAFKEALADARAAAGGADPYAVTARESDAARAEILRWQKDLADWIAGAVKRARSGQSVSGTASFSASGDAGAFSVTLGTVRAVSASGGLDQSVRLAGSFSLSASGAAADGTGTLSADGTFDVTFLRVGGASYVRVDAWGVSDRAKLEASAPEVSAFLAGLDKAKGVALKLPESPDQARIADPMARLDALLATLRSVPAVKVAKKRDGKFLLAADPAFGKALSAAAMGDDAMMAADAAAIDENPFLWLSMADGGATVEGAQDGTSIRVARGAAGSYSGRIANADAGFEMSFSTGKFRLVAGSPMAGGTVTWENGRLDASVGAMGMDASLSGTLTATDADLKMAYMGAPVGSAAWAKRGDRETLDLKVSLAPTGALPDLPRFSFKLAYDLTQSASNEQIVAPASSQDAQTLFEAAAASAPGSARARDTARKSSLQILATGLETYYQDHGAYPEKFDSADMRDLFKGGKFPYVAPGPDGACAAPFTYRVGTTHGVTGDSYVLSSCMELASNRAGAFDPTRYELHVGDAVSTVWGPEQKIPNEKPGSGTGTAR